MREKQVVLFPLYPGVVLGFPLQFEFGSPNIVLRVLLHPGMVQGRVIGNEIEHQPQATLVEPFAQPAQSRIPSESIMNSVASDGKTGPSDVFFTEVGQCLLKFRSPLRVHARDALAGLTGLPHTQKPDPVKTHFGQAVQLRIRNVIQRGGPALPKVRDSSVSHTRVLIW